MRKIACPHCSSKQISTSRVPKDVVVVVPCPACGELVVLFRNKAMALSREIIEQGTFEERKDHIAGIIAQFLEAGLFFGASSRSLPEGVDFTGGDSDDATPETPISEREFEQFVRVDLKRLDEPGYFKKHFGQ